MRAWVQIPLLTISFALPPFEMRTLVPEVSKELAETCTPLVNVNKMEMAIIRGRRCGRGAKNLPRVRIELTAFRL
jgi:hypothetical protein